MKVKNGRNRNKHYAGNATSQLRVDEAASICGPSEASVLQRYSAGGSGKKSGL